MNAASNPMLQPGTTIMVVEDEVLVRLWIAEELRSRALRVIEANNAEEALRVLQCVQGVDLVITGIRMPGVVDGVTFARFVKREYGLPVILASAHYEAALPGRVADAFFAKPYNADQLFAAAVELLKGVKS